MALWLELRCCAAAQPLGKAVADSHAALKDGYAALLAEAEAAGWRRDPKGRDMRCAACAATLADAEPADIAGIPFARFIEGVERCLAGEPPSAWAGRDGFPTAKQFRNAVNRFPQLRARYAAAPDFKGGRGKARAAPVSAERWAAVLDRIRGGERKADICTGVDGWPTPRQWNLRLGEDAGLRAAIEAAQLERRRAAPARPKPPRVARPRPMRRQLDDAARRILAEDRERKRLARQEDKERAKAERLERREREKQERKVARAKEAAARRSEKRRQEREARRVERERERRRNLATEALWRNWHPLNREMVRRHGPEFSQRQFNEFAEGLADEQVAQIEADLKAQRREEKKRRHTRARALVRQPRKVRRVKVEPPELRFDRRLSAPDAEGCRFFLGPVPATVDIGGGKSMKPERAALFFAGVAVPKGQVVDHTCWNDECFAAGHLRPAPANWREKAPQTIPENVLDHVAGVVCEQFGVARADLNRTVDRARGTQPVAFARQVFRYLLHVELEFSQGIIARATDCDRSTVHHSMIVVEDRRDDSAFDQLLDRLAVQVRAGPPVDQQNINRA